MWSTSKRTFGAPIEGSNWLAGEALVLGVLVEDYVHDTLTGIAMAFGRCILGVLISTRVIHILCCHTYCESYGLTTVSQLSS